MGKKLVGRCALCLEERKLAHSHVWPEFFYTPLYDDDGTYFSAINEPRYSERRYQKGLREYLLCEECERRLSRHETYAAGLIRRIQQEPTQGRDGFELDYDYVKFKLFGVSLIWRLHVAKSGRFQSVSVGPNAEIMRKMLLVDDPGPVRRFPFAVTRIEGPESAPAVLTVPKAVRLGSHNAYFGTGLGLRWVFVTAKDAYKIPTHFPFVGFNPQLQVAVERATEAEFIRELRSLLPWLRGGE